jgi:GxxExxY protein
MTTSRTHADRFLLEPELTRQIIWCFYRVYDRLGFGFLESVYRKALAYELTRLGLTVDCEKVIDVWYDDLCIGHFRADVVVEQKVIVELKASERLVDSDRKQLLNYLRATDLEIGLLLNFGPRAQFLRLAYSNARKPYRRGR